MEPVSPVRKLFEFGNFLNELIWCRLTGHSSIDPRSKRRKEAKTAVEKKKMKESYTWWWSSKVVPINACKIIRYRPKMLKRVPKLPPLYIKRLGIGSKRFKGFEGLSRGETSSKMQDWVNGNWIYAIYSLTSFRMSEKIWIRLYCSIRL